MPRQVSRMPRALVVLACVSLACAAAAAGGCARKARAVEGVTRISSVPDELRGVWFGRISLSNRTGQRADARLILGDDPVLMIRDHSTVRLVPREQKRDPDRVGPGLDGRPIVLSKGRRSMLTFATRPIDGETPPWKVRVESTVDRSGKLEPRIVIYLSIAPLPKGASPEHRGEAGGELRKPVPLAEVYGQGPRYPFFAYKDWRSPSWGGQSNASAPNDVRARVTRLAEELASSGRWKCLAGQTFTVSPGKVYQWAQPTNQWIGDRLYAICAHDGDNLAIQVGNLARGTPFHIRRAGTLLDYPTLVLSPYLAGWSRHYMEFQHYWEDPDTARKAEANAKPIKVTLLVFGRSFGDQGPGFDFDSLPR